MSSKTASALTRTLLSLLALGLAVLLFLYFRDRQGPVIHLVPDSGMVSPETEFALALSDEGSGLRSFSVTVSQGGSAMTLLSAAVAGKPASHDASFRLPKESLRDGPITLEVVASDGSLYNFGGGATSKTTLAFTVDTVPPTLSLETPTNNLTRGGSGLVTFTANEELKRAGIFVGDTYFPAYRLADGRFACLFAFPHYVEKSDFAPKLFAEDSAGNRSLRGFPFHANDKQFRHDNINISDNFLEMKMPEFRRYFPNVGDPKDVFLKVNTELRVQNRAFLREIGLRSTSEALWRGEFLRMRNTAPMARFGDVRSYMYNGQKIDEQTHLGIDLASVAHDQVPSANDGVVAFAGEVGIYGLCVIVDHGLGLQSLYAHLSRIDVKDGEVLKKGQILGLSGMTGMAGGDHLHYGVTVAGIPVSPVEWWDGSWIKNNISSKLDLK